ncbi:hypothetical protein Mal35_29870 [Gimesia maris]|nr:hypothetical protein Mal35_29870 [Gimesia maris]
MTYDSLAGHLFYQCLNFTDILARNYDGVQSRFHTYFKISFKNEV